jgi:hypothetical protein
MGILLVAGFVVLVIGFLQLAVPSSDNSEPVVEVPMASVLVDRLGVPGSSRIVSLASIDGRLVILVELADGEQRLFTVEPDIVLRSEADDDR